jgi:hypothetical protein
LLSADHKGEGMTEKRRDPDENKESRRPEIEDDDVQGHRFSEDLTGGDDVAGHVQRNNDEQEEASSSRE